MSKARPKAPARRRRIAWNAKVSELVIEHTARLLACRLHKGEIKQMLAKRYKLAPRTCEDALSEARKMLVAASGKTEIQHKDDAYQFWNAMVGDKSIGWRFRHMAQEAIAKLLALNGPIKVQLSGGITHRASVAHALLSDEKAAKMLEELDDHLASARGENGASRDDHSARASNRRDH